VYMTTNYDDFMGQALEKSARLNGEKPRLMVCPWNRLVRQKLARADQFLSNTALKQAEPAVQQPIIFHLHGHMALPESLVLTEDDYLEFLVELTRDRKLIPLQIREAIAESSLLFVGYRLSDWTFRVIFRSISNLLPFNVRGKHISVQLEPPKDTTLPPEKRDAFQEKTKEYLRKSLQLQDVEVFWISADEFATELNRRWDQKIAPAPQAGAGSGSTVP
jgi:hypothetical protein